MKTTEDEVVDDHTGNFESIISKYKGNDDATQLIKSSNPKFRSLREVSHKELLDVSNWDEKSKAKCLRRLNRYDRCKQLKKIIDDGPPDVLSKLIEVIIPWTTYVVLNASLPLIVLMVQVDNQAPYNGATFYTLCTAIAYSTLYCGDSYIAASAETTNVEINFSWFECVKIFTASIIEVLGFICFLISFDLVSETVTQGFTFTVNAFVFIIVVILHRKISLQSALLVLIEFATVGIVFMVSDDGFQVSDLFALLYPTLRSLGIVVYDEWFNQICIDHKVPSAQKGRIAMISEFIASLCLIPIIGKLSGQYFINFEIFQSMKGFWFCILTACRTGGLLAWTLLAATPGTAKVIGFGSQANGMLAMLLLPLVTLEMNVKNTMVFLIVWLVGLALTWNEDYENHTAELKEHIELSEELLEYTKIHASTFTSTKGVRRGAKFFDNSQSFEHMRMSVQYSENSSESESTQSILESERARQLFETSY